MAATAWDEGIDFYAAASPRSGYAWCQVAVTIAQVTNGLLAQQVRLAISLSLLRRYVPAGRADLAYMELLQWQAELDELQKRYGGEERDALVR